MRISIKVKPRSKTDEVVGEGDSLIVRVKEPPMEGRANRAVVRLLAKHYGVPESSVRICRGSKTRDKVIELLPSTGGTQNER